MLAYKLSWGLRREMKEKIKFPDAYIHRSFSPSDKAVELLFEGGQAVVAMTYHERKVSAGVELGVLSHP